MFVDTSKIWLTLFCQIRKITHSQSSVADVIFDILQNGTKRCASLPSTAEHLNFRYWSLSVRIQKDVPASSQVSTQTAPTGFTELFELSEKVQFFLFYKMPCIPSYFPLLKAGSTEPSPFILRLLRNLIRSLQLPLQASMKIHEMQKALFGCRTGFLSFDINWQ